MPHSPPYPAAMIGFFLPEKPKCTVFSFTFQAMRAAKITKAESIPRPLTGCWYSNRQ